MTTIAYDVQHKSFDLRAFINVSENNVLVANHDTAGTAIPESYCIPRTSNNLTALLSNKCVAGFWVEKSSQEWREQLASAGFKVKRITR